VQSPNTLYPITVAADGHRNRTKTLNRALRDEQLGFSLINASIARDSGGTIQPLSTPKTGQDTRGREYECTHFVELRWRQCGLARSWSEIFHLVDNFGIEVDAILRNDISLEIPPNPECLPLEQRPLTEGRAPATRARSIKPFF
jgi:hypothetical protein